MTTPIKCVSCNTEIPDLGDITQKSEFCEKCKDNEARQEFYANMKLMVDQNEITDEEIIQIIGSTVKHDNANKMITTANLACNYTDEDQTNLGFIAGSSTGKSYLPIEITTGYIPKENIMLIGYCSPTAFFHEYGTLLPDPTDPKLKDPETPPEKIRKVRFIDLHQHVIVFLDQPHEKLLENLRPLLSHDQKQITMKITNRSEKSGNRAETIVIEGYPTVIFCTANYKQDEQEKTRLLLLSPEVSQEKFRETIMLRIHKEGNRFEFRRELEQNKERNKLAARFDNLKKAKINQVIIPDELQNLIYEKFSENHEFFQARNQRDIGRLICLIKGFALINFYNRSWQSIFHKKHGVLEQDPITVIIVELKDIEMGFKYYATVGEANELGLPPEVLELYKALQEQMEENKDGFSQMDFQRFYFEKNRKILGRDKATKFIQTLEVAGLLQENPNSTDKKTKKYMCVRVGGTQTNKEVILEKVHKCWIKFGIPYNIEYENKPFPSSTPPPPRTHISKLQQGTKQLTIEISKQTCYPKCKHYRQASCEKDNYGMLPPDTPIVGCRSFEAHNAVEDRF